MHVFSVKQICESSLICIPKTLKETEVTSTTKIQPVRALSHKTKQFYCKTVKANERLCLSWQLMGGFQIDSKFEKLLQLRVRKNESFQRDNGFNFGSMLRVDCEGPIESIKYRWVPQNRLDVQRCLNKRFEISPKSDQPENLLPEIFKVLLLQCFLKCFVFEISRHFDRVNTGELPTSECNQ